MFKKRVDTHNTQCYHVFISTKQTEKDERERKAMGARRSINRSRTDPYGTDFKDVLQRAKRFYKDGVFEIYQFNSIFCSSRESVSSFSKPAGARTFKKVNRKWVEM